MNYYALFLNGNSYVEKCLLLMRFISNPFSRSFPHITVRLFSEFGSRIVELNNRTFTHLNIIEPGAFNLHESKPPYVIFLQCESEELEGIEYKPDFPCSRLHITIYEGNDYNFANKLYLMLKDQHWHFKLSFDQPRKLTHREIGIKTREKPDFQVLYQEILGSGYQNFWVNKEDVRYKLTLIEEILIKLKEHLQNNAPEQVESIYTGGGYFDVYSIEKIDNVQGVLDFDRFLTGKYSEIKGPTESGIFITPPEYAGDMAKCALEIFGEENRKIDFGDSSVGTGTLFLALKSLVDKINRTQKMDFEFRSAIGIDIDRDMAAEAYARCSKRGLRVIHGDALLPHIQLGTQRNVMLVNPPFKRCEDIPNEYRNLICQLAKEQTNITVSGKADLYVYHMLIMHKWLVDSGVAVWLLPITFMQAHYGEAIRSYLLNNVQLIRIHVYDEKLVQFEGKQVATSIVVFKKVENEKYRDVLFTYGDSVEQPENNVSVNRNMLLEHFDNWRKLLNNQNSLNKRKKQITFGDLFEIKRGLATGDNSFFVITKEKAQQYHIPDCALRPLIPKERYLKNLIIEAREDGYPDVEPQLFLIDCDLDENTIQRQYPDFYEYLQLAKVKGKDGKAVIDRYLVRNRKLWYKQERREPPVFLLTYMGRNKKNLPPLYFVWNKSNGIALNTYLLLYPKKLLMDKLKIDSNMYEVVLEALNETAKKVISSQTRVYSGGLKKIEPKELCKLPVVGLDALVVDYDIY